MSQPPSRSPSKRPRRRLGSAVAKRPSIHRYVDYRAYLRDLLAHLKSAHPGVSYRTLAESCGLRSPSFLHLVVNGKRNLGREPDRLAAIARGLGLSQRESKTFVDLVALNQARDGAQRGKQLKKLVRRRAFREYQRIDGDRLALLQSWQAVAVHALADAPAFTADPAWLCTKFPGMTKKQAREALDLLERAGFVRRNADGKIEPLEPHLTTHDEVAGEVVRQYHLQALALAADAVNELPAGRRNFGVVNARIPAARLPEALAHFHGVINAFHDYLAGLEAPEGLTVVQASFQLFPLTADEE